VWHVWDVLRRKKDPIRGERSSQILHENVIKCIKVSSGCFGWKNSHERGLGSCPRTWIRRKTSALQNLPWGQTKLVPNGVNIFANSASLSRGEGGTEWKRIMGSDGMRDDKQVIAMPLDKKQWNRRGASVNGGNSR
jgi:hypothetical protein